MRNGSAAGRQLLMPEFLVGSPPLPTVSPPRTLQRLPVKWRGVPGIGKKLSQIVPASERLSRLWNPDPLVNPGLSATGGLHEWWSYLPSFKRANNFTLNDEFRPDI
ncbi:unnamed protein product, partial [Laminaria digitata]